MSAPVHTLTHAAAFKFAHTVLPGRIAVGNFEGHGECLAAATTGGRVMLHAPYGDASRVEASSGLRGIGGIGSNAFSVGVGVSVSAHTHAHIRFFNINRDVTSLAAGRLLPGADRDLLLVGTTNSLQAYDVRDNRDAFFKEVPDAVTGVCVGAWTHAQKPGVEATATPLAFAGGNCLIQAFDATGRDAYWTVTGDVVTCVAVADVDGDGRAELLAGSADFDIRAYRGEDVVGEVTETDKVTAVLALPGGRFAYALANGTVGVYNGATMTRIWRVKTKAKAVTLAAFDLDGDGTLELVAGYANGRIEVRRIASGDLVYRDTTTVAATSSTAIAGLAVSDYRGDGKPLLLVVYTDGEVRGYAQTDADTLAAIRASQASTAPSTVEITAPAATPKGSAGAASAEAVTTAATAAAATASAVATVASLLEEVSKLEAQVISVETQIAAAAAPPAGTPTTRALPHGAIPANTDITIDLEFNSSTRRVELVISPNNPGVALRAVAVFALDAGVFGSDRESCLVVNAPGPAAGTSLSTAGAFAAPPAGESTPCGDEMATLRVPLAPPNNVATEVRVQAVLGSHRNAQHFALVEKQYRIPKFFMFQPLPPRAAAPALPRGSVTMQLKERAARVGMWIARAFPVSGPDAVVVTAGASPALDARFLHLRSGTAVRITVASEHGGATAFSTDDMALAGEMVQDLASFLGVGDLEATAEFPDEFSGFRGTLSRLDELNAVRNRLTGDSAALSGTIKTMVVQAEDARLLVDMEAARKCYGELRAAQGELLGEYLKRAQNHGALMATLKDVNQMIQKAANLRVGEPKARIIAACRNALKANTPLAMLSVMATGKSGLH